MRTKLSITAVMVLGLVLAGCAGPKVTESLEGAASASDTTDSTSGGSDTGGLNSGSGISGDGSSQTSGISGGPDDPLSKRIIYFDYDSSSLSDDSRIIVEAHSQYLADNPGLNISLDGHADERGTREYNLALGERRAQTVARLMNALGVDASRTQTISYGEERPLSDGSNEAAWSENRRVELNYSN